MLGMFFEKQASRSSSASFIRPSDWLPMPTSTVDRVAILAGVWDNGSNFSALSAAVSAGEYTVDWGDGTVTNYSSGATAEYKHNYATVGNLSSLGYRQVIIKIYPTTPGAAITALDLGKKHSQVGLSNSYSQPWLDIEINTPSCTSFAIYSTIRSQQVRQIRISAMGTFTAGTNQFANCFSLANLTLPAGFGSVQTNGQAQFQNCSSLTTLTLPAGFGSAQTNGINQFQNCYSLANLSLPAGFGSAQTNGQAQFQKCASLTTLTLPAGFGSAQTVGTNQFNSCSSLANLTLPAGFGSALSTTASMFDSSSDLSRLTNFNAVVGFSLDSLNFATTELEEVFDYLGKASGAQTITITNNWGAPTPVSLAGATVSGSTIVTMASTAGLTVGMEIAGTGISDAVAVTTQGAADTVTRTAHGIPNGKRVAFASIVTTTGISTYTIYYVVNAAANTFQVSLTAGGAPIDLVSDGSGTIIYGTLITAITPNVSITLDVPASATGSPTTSSAVLQRSKAKLKGWTVAG